MSKTIIIKIEMPDGVTPVVQTTETAFPNTDTQTQVSETEVDSRGVPWSAEHHAANKSTKKDGSWSARRNGDKVALAQYESQYLNKTVAPQAPSNPTTTPSVPKAPPTIPAKPSAPSTHAKIIAKLSELMEAGMPEADIEADLVANFNVRLSEISAQEEDVQEMVLNRLGQYQ